MKEPVDYAALCKLAVDLFGWSHTNSEKVDESIIEYARQSGKLVLDYQNPEKLCRCLQRVLDQVWDATAKRKKEIKINQRYDES